MGELMWFINIFLGVSVMVFIAGSVIWFFALLIAIIAAIIKIMRNIFKVTVRMDNARRKNKAYNRNII